MCTFKVVYILFIYENMCIHTIYMKIYEHEKYYEIVILSSTDGKYFCDGCMI